MRSRSPMGSPGGRPKSGARAGTSFRHGRCGLGFGQSVAPPAPMFATKVLGRPNRLHNRN